MAIYTKFIPTTIYGRRNLYKELMRSLTYVRDDNFAFCVVLYLITFCKYPKYIM